MGIIQVCLFDVFTLLFVGGGGGCLYNIWNIMGILQVCLYDPFTLL